MQDFTIMFVVGSFAAANKNSAVLMLSSNSLLAEIIHQLWDKIHTKKSVFTQNERTQNSIKKIWL